MSYRNDLLEEEIKNRLRNDFFKVMTLMLY